MEILLNLDKFMFDIMSGSGFTILALLGILKILARETKWSGDDKILEMLSGVLGGFSKTKRAANQLLGMAKADTEKLSK